MASAAALSLSSPIAASSSALVNKCGALKRPKHLPGLSVYSPCKAQLKRTAAVVMNNGVAKEEQKQSQALAVANSMAMVAAMVIPEIAEAATPGVSPSLKNFLLSIVSGGVVLAFIGVAVIGVSNFDPVKRT
ncbi:hypothetical protein SUGI_0262070 [Cryptomeria japonica]|uniref:uncharacterized protein LOC131035084 n=1 Tax=Cryptomeria japonica TaxID=3369 RepID=UPI002408E535|nr:uncharacterized protein LOC131035084 [Cryptomeria japonica]GLJ15873.1 hypothetical protein SUGI_0262070 [Cryptomeria japonica]